MRHDPIMKHSPASVFIAQTKPIDLRCMSHSGTSMIPCCVYISAVNEREEAAPTGCGASLCTVVLVGFSVILVVFTFPFSLLAIIKVGACIYVYWTLKIWAHLEKRGTINWR